MTRLIPSILLLTALSLFSFTAWAGDTTLLSTGVGAAIGGLAGSQIGKGDGRLAATGAGVFLGGLMGHSVGQSMERSHSAYGSGGYSPMTSYYPAYQSYEPTYVGPPAAPPPQVIYVQPETVDYYTPRHRAVYVEEGYVGPQAPHVPGRHCREFTQTIRIDGHSQESYGTACLRPDGSWQIEQ